MSHKPFMKGILTTGAALLLALPSQADTYYWIGGDSVEWANGSNWSLTEGGAAAGSYPSDYSIDEAVVGSAVTITLPSSNANVSNLYINANVSFTGGKIHAKTISGSGKLTMLDGTTFYATEYCTTVSVDVEIPQNATVNVSNNGGSKNYGYGVMFTDECALTGAGTIVFDSYRPSNPLYWDARGFSGTVIVVKDSQTRNNTTIHSENATHEGMSWQVVNSGAGDTGFITQEGTYKFGSLTGMVYIAKSKEYAYVKNVLMEIGALNGDDVLGGLIARTASRANDGAYIRKVGTGVLSSSVRGVNGYYIKEGVLNIASDDGLSAKDDNNNPGTDIVFEGGTLRLAAEVTKDVSAYIALGSSSSPVVFDDEGRDHVWSKSLGSMLSGGLTKKGSGILTLAVAPAYTGTTTVEGGVLVVPQGTTIAELSCAGGKITVPLTGAEDETAVLTVAALAEGTTAEDLEEAVTVPGVTMSVESGEGGYVVKATRTAQTFTWTGMVDSSWTMPGNWTVGGVAAVTAPVAIDTAHFNASAEVVIEGGTSISNLSVATAATVAISGGGTLTGIWEFGSESDKGGAIALNGASLESAALVTGTYLHWYGDIAVGGGANVTNFIHCKNADSTSGLTAIVLDGDLSGSGNLCLDRTGAKSNGTYAGRGGVSLNGNNELFAGVCVIRSGSQTRGPSTFMSGTSGSALARWIYPDNIDDSVDARSGTAAMANSVLKFGTYEGKSYIMGCASHTGNTIEIGGLGEDFTCSLSARSSTAERANNNATLKKVGGGTMTFGEEAGNPCFNTYEMNGGVLKFANMYITRSATGQTTYTNPTFTFTGGTLALDDCATNTVGESLLDLSPYIKNSTKAISVFVDEGQQMTWATALAQQTADETTGVDAGLVKKGAGTLTLTAVPKYTGLTTVKEGTLVVPEGSDITYNPLSAGTLTGVTPTKFAYPAGTTLTGAETTKTFDGVLDISNVTAIDVSGATLVKGQPYVIASATTVTGFTKDTIELTLPAGTDPVKWTVKIMSIDAKRSLCVAPPTNPFVIIVR